jgi:uncharacterized lipoprotein YddW (UPF0748 family)
MVVFVGSMTRAAARNRRRLLAAAVFLVRDIVSRYAVDGVHLDYVRYPTPDFDFSRAALDAFRSETLSDLAPDARRAYDRRFVSEPLVYTRAFPVRWRSFRVRRLTELVGRLREEVRRLPPEALVSLAAGPDAVEFAAQIPAARGLAGETALWAGIGAYRLSSAQIVGNVAAARQAGAAGILLFSYDTLTAASRGADDLTRVGRALGGSR